MAGSGKTDECVNIEVVSIIMLVSDDRRYGAQVSPDAELRDAWR